MLLEILIGIGLAAICVLLVKTIFKDKEIPFWRTGLLAAAIVYVVLGLIGQGWGFIGVDLIGVVLYGALAWASRKNLIWLPLGWALHILWDVLVHPAGHPGYVPNWYPGVCLGFDILVAGYLGWLIFKLQENNHISSSPS
ncbi:MAG: DUF6010 family protein [Bacteroidota bacterium]